MPSVATFNDSDVAPEGSARRPGDTLIPGGRGFETGMGALFLRQTRQFADHLIESGVRAVDLWDALCAEILPLVEAERPGYASPSEGLIDLITAEGGCVSVAEATALYRRPNRVTPQAITRLIRNGRIIAYQTGSGSYSVPVWQFAPEGGLILGITMVTHRIKSIAPETSGLSYFAFFLQSNPLTYNETPLNALRRGRSKEVLEAAEAHAS